MKNIFIYLILLITSFATMYAKENDAKNSKISLEVMSFNMRCGFKEKNPKDNWDHRKSIIVDVIRKHKPDVIGSQELTPPQLKQIRSLIPEYSSFGVGREKNLEGESMTIFYKTSVVKPLATETFWLSETPDIPGSRSWGNKWIRCLTWGRFFHVKSKKVFYFFNTHLATVNESVRLKESQLIIQKAKSIAGNLPIFIVGDFNSEGGESLSWHAFKEAGYKDARDESITEAKGSFSTWSSFKAPKYHLKERIDWILFKGNGIRVDEYETINDNREGNYPSDHYPIRAKVTIQ